MYYYLYFIINLPINVYYNNDIKKKGSIVMEFLGTKYQIYEGDDLKVFRLIKINSNENTYTLKCGKEKRKVKIEELKDKYIRLTPDASIGVMVVKDNVGKNVIININKASDLARNDKVPSIIIMQDTYSALKNAQAQHILGNDKIYVSECYVKEIMGKDDPMIKDLLTYDKILYSIDAFLYIEDTMDDIEEILQSGINEINSALKEIKSYRCRSNNNFVGYFDNLKDLLNFNNFIANFRYIFNITQVEFVIDIGNNKTEDGEEINSIGELVSICEKQGFIPKYYTDGPQDKVDRVVEDLRKYTKDLVSNETNLDTMFESAQRQIEEEQERITNAAEAGENNAEEEDKLFDYDDYELTDKDYEDMSDFIEAEALSDEEVE